MIFIPQIYAETDPIQFMIFRELKRPYPERLKLESQCISTLALFRGEAEVKANCNELNITLAITLGSYKNHL